MTNSSAIVHGHKPKSELNRKEIDAHTRLLLPVLLAIKLTCTLLCEMCDLHFTFVEDRTKTAVAIESDRFCGQTYGRTDTQTDTSGDFISVQCHELHWTDNNTIISKTIDVARVAAGGADTICKI